MNLPGSPFDPYGRKNTPPLKEGMSALYGSLFSEGGVKGNRYKLPSPARLHTVGWELCFVLLAHRPLFPWFVRPTSSTFLVFGSAVF